MTEQSESYQHDRIYFQVMIEYEECPATSEIPEDERSLESETFGDYDKVMEIARHTVKQIHEMFPDTQLVELDLDQAPDGYHLLVVDGDGSRVVKVGITGYDYSNETIH